MYKRIRIMKRLAFIMMALLLALMPAEVQTVKLTADNQIVYADSTELS